MQHASEDTQMSYIVWAQDLAKCGGGMNTLFKKAPRHNKAPALLGTDF